MTTSVLLLGRRRRTFAFALSATAAVAMFSPVTPIAWFSLNFAGFTAGEPDYWSPLALCALAVVLGVNGAVSIVGFVRSRKFERTHGSGVTAVTTIALYAAIVVALW